MIEASFKSSPKTIGSEVDLTAFAFAPNSPLKRLNTIDKRNKIKATFRPRPTHNSFSGLYAQLQAQINA